jgi:hypothetical protein
LPYDTIFRFNATETRSIDKFVAKFGPPDEDSVTKELTFSRRQTGSFNSAEYRDEKNQPFNRTGIEGVLKEIVVKDDKGGEMKFKPDVKASASKGGDAPQGYHQVDGRVRMEQLGKVSTFRWGLFIANLLLNAIHLALWFVCLWLLLRYQWSHALFLSLILWGMATWALPLLLEKTQLVAQTKAGVRTTQVWPQTAPLSPVLGGEGLGGRGPALAETLSPSPQPLSPEYRGEGLWQGGLGPKNPQEFN